MPRALALASIALASSLSASLVACSSSHATTGAGASSSSISATSTSTSTSSHAGAVSGSGGASAQGGSGTGGSSVGTGGSDAGGLGPAHFDPGDLDSPSDGATITFEQIGAAGSYPSIRDPATGPCDAYDANACCLSKDTIAGNQLTPWDEELIMTLRGPMQVKQLAVYQPSGAEPGQWVLVSGWDSRAPGAPLGITFAGDATPKASFAGGVGSECLVNVATATPFACGPGSVPFCAASSSIPEYGWAGSKLFVVLATMPHAGTGAAPAACSTGTTGNWYDASWVGLSVGELVRAGAFSSCQCYAKSPTMGSLADGCGQLNVF